MAYVSKKTTKKGVSFRVIHKTDKLNLSNTFTKEAQANAYVNKIESLCDSITSVRHNQKNISFKKLPLSNEEWKAVCAAVVIDCEILSEKLRPIRYTQLLHDAVEEFLTSGYCPRKTVKKLPGKEVRNGLRNFWLKYFDADKMLADVTKEDIVEALAEKAKTTTTRARGREQSEATPVSLKRLDNLLSHYRSFSHWCKLEGKIDVRPEEEIKNQSENKPNPRPLGLSEDRLDQFDMSDVENAVGRLFDAAAHYDRREVPSNIKQFKRMYLLCLFAVTTGRRMGECLSLKWSHINLKAGTYSVYISKTDEITSFPLVGKLLEEMKKARASQKVVNIKDAGFVFSMEGSKTAYSGSALDKSFQVVLEDAELLGHHFHDLRDTCATMVLNSSESWAVVAEVLGHSSVGALQKRYAVFFPGVKAKTLENALPAFLK